MNSASELNEFRGRSALLDAGPLQTMFVLHHARQFRLGTERATNLIRDVRPELVNIDEYKFWRILKEFRRLHYTQLGLAEALRFRDHSQLKRDQETIRRSALDAIREHELIEKRTPDGYLTWEDLISLVGLADALHINWLYQDTDLILLTDDGRLRQFGGNATDRIFVLKELLSYYEELA